MRFPAGFLFGAANSAYQIEGAADEDGRTPSIWDTFCQVPGAVTHGDTGAVACDHYHRVDTDLDLIADMGLTAYRFSIAWPRIIPDGTGTVSQKGLDFYRRLVDGLHARNIEPFCSAMVGQLEGRHAPGIVDLNSALTSAHHLLLAHGQAVGIIRRSAPGARVGITHLLSDISAASGSYADQAAAWRRDGYENRWFLDAVLHGAYPADMLDWY